MYHPFLGEWLVTHQVEVVGGKGTVQLLPEGIIHPIRNPTVRIEVWDARAAMAALIKVPGESE
jgi:hypothetical protein